MAQTLEEKKKIAKNVVAEYDLALGPETLAAEKGVEFVKKRTKELTSEFRTRDKLTWKEAEKRAKEQAKAEGRRFCTTFCQSYMEREEQDKDAVAALFEQMLLEVAGYWDSPAAFAADAPTAYAKWRVILMRHDATAKYQIPRSKVLELVRDGQGFERYGELGGDPFDDAALFIALASGQKNARRVFDERFKETITGYILAWASNAKRLAEDEKDAWYEAFLGEMFVREVALKYRGTAGASVFFFKTVQRFCDDWIGSEKDAVKLKKLALRMLKNPGVRRYDYVAHDDDGKEPFAYPEPVDLDREYWEHKIADALNWALTLPRMTPLRRRVLRLGCEAAMENEENMAEVAERLNLPRHRFNSLYYGAWKYLRRALERFDEETSTEMLERLMDGRSREFRNFLNKIDPATGEILNCKC